MCIFGLDTIWCVGAAIVVGVGIVAGAIIYKAKKIAEPHPATTESFRAAGVAICTRLYTSGAQWETCVGQVNAEAARALANQEQFDTSNVSSIPTSEWP
ncbi:MAG: hypothetical protein K5777_00335 [Nitrosopumilus sp.]|nr:hypothetical protein [Nitrosopumilus sp.]